MTDEDNARQFKSWLEGNSDKHEEIQRVYCHEHLLRLGNGKKSFSSMPIGKRIRMHEITGLSFLQVEGEVSPRELDMEKIRKGEQPRVMIMRRIEYDCISVGDVVSKLGVGTSSFNRYMNSESIEPSLVSKIEDGLTRFYSSTPENSKPDGLDSGRPWYEQFKEWLVSNRDNIAVIQQVTKVYSKDALLNFCKGSKDITSIPEGKRIRLHEITGLSFFELDGHHPLELDMEKIINGQQPRVLLARRITYDGFTTSTIAKEVGLTPDDVYRYAYDRTKNMSQERRTKIESALGNYFRKSSELQGNVKTSSLPLSKLGQSSVVVRPIEYAQRNTGSVIDALAEVQKNLATITSRIEGSAVALELLAFEKPTLEQRISIVCTAINVLATQTEYFKNRSQEEREALAKAIDVKDWGYVVSVLGRIDQPSSFQTYDRAFNRPSRRSQ